MIVAAADGSSLSNPGPAGWAWFVDDQRWAAGGWAHGTNNMGELMAVLDLLQQTADAPEALHVLCDSQYAINCCTKWISGWKRRGWRKADGKPVLNVEILKELDLALAGRAVTFEWVKGHAGHELNEAADQRARAAAEAFRDRRSVDVGPGWAGASSPARELAFVPSVKDEPPLDLFSFGEADPSPGVTEPRDEPVTLSTDTELVVVLERELLTDACRADPDRLAVLLHPHFVEHGSSGGILTRNRAVLGLDSLGLTPRFDLLGADQYGPDLIGLRYRLRLGSRTTLRFSLWQRGRVGWELRFHQGTPVSG